jgi:hypothetical protein
MVWAVKVCRSFLFSFFSNFTNYRYRSNEGANPFSSRLIDFNAARTVEFLPPSDLRSEPETQGFVAHHRLSTHIAFLVEG